MSGEQPTVTEKGAEETGRRGGGQLPVFLMVLAMAAWLAWATIFVDVGRWKWDPPTVVPSAVFTASISHTAFGGPYLNLPFGGISETSAGFALFFTGAVGLWVLPTLEITGDPFSTLYVYIFLVALGAFVFFAFTSKRLESRWAGLFFGVLYLLHPFLIRPVVVDIHPPHMLFLAVALLGREYRNFPLFAVGLLLSAFSHPFAQIIAFGICAVVWWEGDGWWRRRLRYLAPVFPAALLAFFGTMLYIKMTGDLTGRVEQPVWVSPHVYWGSLALFGYLVASLGGLPLKAWRWLLPVVPSVLYAALSVPTRMHGDFPATVAIFFIAAVEASRHLKLRPAMPLKVAGATAIVAISMLGYGWGLLRPLQRALPPEAVTLTPAESGLRQALLSHRLPEPCATRIYHAHLLMNAGVRDLADYDMANRKDAPCLLIREGKETPNLPALYADDLDERIEAADLEVVYRADGMTLALRPGAETPESR